MSSLYSRTELEQWRPIFTEQVTKAKAAIERQLMPEKRARLRQTQILTPLMAIKSPKEECKDPFYYGARHPQIVIPILSLKFLHDLIFAQNWLAENGYIVKVHDYVNMLKYKRVIDFHGKYPSPLDALEIPHTSLGKPLYKDIESSGVFETIYKDALLFITAHEAAHVVHGDEQSSPKNEEDADAFAFEILTRYRGVPFGVSDFFLFASFWVPNGGDFEDFGEYRIWLTAEATHPLTPSRMRKLGTKIIKDRKRYFPGLPDSHPYIGEVMEWAKQLGTIADSIDRRTSDFTVFHHALHTDLSTLALEKNSP